MIYYKSKKRIYMLKERNSCELYVKKDTQFDMESTNDIPLTFRSKKITNDAHSTGL